MLFVKQNTRFEVSCTKFMWTLENCAFFMGVNRTKEFTSENFRVTKTNQLCYATFCMNNRILQLHMDGYYLPLYFIITLSCTNKNGTPIKSQTFTKHLNSIDKRISEMKLYQQNLQHYMDNDTLTFLITIEDIREANSVEIVVEPSATCQLYRQKFTPSNIDAMYTNQELCDVTFIVGDEKLHAHSVVLAAVSPHFLSVFSKNCLENKTKHIVDMTEDVNVKSDVLRAFLEFNYGIKSMLELKDMVINLTIMAKKYDIAGMQKACEHLMSDTLDKENIIATLMFAVEHQLATLKKKALRLAKLHIDAVKESKDFEKLYQNKELMKELL